jgi:hypothetical protein
MSGRLSYAEGMVTGRMAVAALPDDFEACAQGRRE